MREDRDAGGVDHLLGVALARRRAGRATPSAVADREQQEQPAERRHAVRVEDPVAGRQQRDAARERGDQRRDRRRAPRADSRRRRPASTSADPGRACPTRDRRRRARRRATPARPASAVRPDHDQHGRRTPAAARRRRPAAPATASIAARRAGDREHARPAPGRCAPAAARRRREHGTRPRRSAVRGAPAVQQLAHRRGRYRRARWIASGSPCLPPSSGPSSRASTRRSSTSRCPAIRDDLGGGLAGQQWISNAYLLTLGVADPRRRLARRPVRRAAGLLASASPASASPRCCARSRPSVEVLVVARALQGVFGALLTPSALAVIIAAFPPAERGAAIGSWTAWTGIAFVVGPLAGGVLVDADLVALDLPRQRPVRARRRCSSSPRRSQERPRAAARPHVDVVGAVLCALGLGGPVYGLTRQPEAGWGAPEVWLPLVAGVALLAAFVRWERRSRDADAPARPVRAPQLRGRQPRDRRHVRRAVASTSSRRRCSCSRSPATRALEAGLATMPITVVMFAAVQADGRAGRPVRPAAVHGRRPAAGRRRPAAVPARRRRRPLRHRGASRRCSSSRSACR